jgi:hypothetical protein
MDKFRDVTEIKNVNLACAWQPITVPNGPIQTGSPGSCLTVNNN